MPRYTAYYDRDGDFDFSEMFKAENDDEAMQVARKRELEPVQSSRGHVTLHQLDRHVTVFEAETEVAE